MISIIVPVYNLEKYIEKCILSILSQTYQDWELLLIDDGSKDKSLQLCQAWAKKDSRIRVFHQENQGVSAARNFGLSIMKGDFIVFVDGDDWIDCDCFQRMMENMKDNVQLVCCDFFVEKENNCQHNVFFHKEEFGILSQEECLRDYYSDFLYTKTIWGKIFRKELWAGVCFKKLKNSEDHLAMFEIIQKLTNVYFMEEKFYHYLQRSSGASHKVDESYYHDVLYTLDISFVYACERALPYKEEAGALYIDMAYGLLKIYESENRKEEARELILKMKTVYKEAEIKHPSRAQQLLNIPVWMIYCLLWFKRLIKG